MDQYIVAPGDNLNTILRKLENTRGSYFSEKKIQELILLNHLKDLTSFSEGQTLFLPPLKEDFFLRCTVPHSNIYTVRYGDTLWKISETYLGDPSKKHEIARLNQLKDENQIFVGQELQLPHYSKNTHTHIQSQENAFKLTPPQKVAKHILARSFLFILADETFPSGKVVRKVIFPNEIQGSPDLISQILQPEKYGISPRNPYSNTSIGRHVLGMTDSKYISASQRPLGSPRFDGKRYWINTKKLHRAGVVIHDAKAIAKDLERIAQKTKNPLFLAYIDEITHKSQFDREVLIEGVIPPKAIKGAVSKGITHGLQFVSAVGIVFSGYDLTLATQRSVKEQTIKPIAAETVRQLGGWGAAWAGIQIGASAGALVGIETGPGAVLTSTAGGLFFGISGYLGANWIADYIENFHAESNDE